MSKKKTDAEMIRGLIQSYISAHPEAAKEIEKITKEIDPRSCNDEDCEDCPWFDGWICTLDDDNEEDEGDKDRDEEGYYKYPECEAHDGDCTECSYWNSNEDYCELDNNEEEDNNCNDCHDCKYYYDDDDSNCSDCPLAIDEEEEKENPQIEDLSKLVKSVGAVLGEDMGVLIFDKSNKKDMEKLSRIFADYAKRLYQI